MVNVDFLALCEIVTQDDGQFACQEATDEEEGSCDMPECPFGDWGEWSTCSGEMCGGPGTNTRSRDCIPAVSTYDIWTHLSN